MPIVAIGALLMTLFVGMIALCLTFGLPCPIEGFDDATAENPVLLRRFRTFSSIATPIMAAIGITAAFYVKRNWEKARLAAALTMAFALLSVMIWGIAVTGRPPANQVLIFASMQFLIAGLIIFNPIDSLVYFGATFALFGIALQLSGFVAGHTVSDLTYLAVLNISVSWIVYGLFRRGVYREQAIADQSRRDALTGAKNRHYLRDDFVGFIGKQQFILLCDIDDFKHYNDSMSHDTGDLLLKDFYYALREAFGDECTYRYGGDEFLVVSPDFDERDFLKKIKVCQKQLEHVSLENGETTVPFSGGYTFGAPKRIEDFRAMLHEADEVLLDVKHSGKNRVSGHAFA